jgi:cell division protein FtsB
MRSITMFSVMKVSFFAMAGMFLIYHALHGNHGLYALAREQYRIEHLKQDLEKVTHEREVLERRVRLMRDESLDPDLLEEQARRYLGVTGKDEVVVVVE